MSTASLARGPSGGIASEAVIADARRRQRRRRLAFVATAAAVAVTFVVFRHPGIGSGRGAGLAARNSPPAKVVACLQGHAILVSGAPTSVDFGSVPAIRISFALVPGQRLDNATVFFEHSRSDANHVLATLVRRFKSDDPAVRSYFTVAGTAVAFWNSHHPTAASAAMLQSCL